MLYVVVGGQYNATQLACAGYVEQQYFSVTDDQFQCDCAAQCDEYVFDAFVYTDARTH